MPRASRVLLIGLIFVAWGLNQRQSAGEQDAAAQNARRAVRDRLTDQARKLEQAGKLTEAAAVGEQLLSAQADLTENARAAVAETLEWLGRIHSLREDFPEAKRRWQEAIQLRVQLHGKENWRVADARAGLALTELLQTLNPQQRERLREAGRVLATTTDARDPQSAAERMAPAQAAVAVRRDLLGAEHRDYATGLNNLAGLFVRCGDTAAAEPLYQQALEIRLKALGDRHPLYAQSLHNLADLYAVSQREAAAVPLLQRAMEIYQRSAIEADSDALQCLQTLRAVYDSLGNAEGVAALYLREIEILKEAHGDSDLRCAQTMREFGQFYLLADRYEEAAPLYLRALEIRRKSLGQQHALVADSLEDLALLHSFNDQEGAAIPLFRQSLEIRKALQGSDHPQYLKTLDRLASAHEFLDQYADAKPLRQQLVATNRRLQGENHLDYIQSLYKLGFVHWALHQHEDAERLYRQVWQFYEQAGAPSDRDRARILTALGAVYNSLGRYAQAAVYLEQLAAAEKKASGPRHPDYAYSLNNLGAARRNMGDLLSAEALYREALEIYDATTGPESFESLACRNNLAEVLQITGDFAAARAHFERVLRVREGNREQDTTNCALSLNNLGMVLAALGDVAEGERLLRRALKIYQHQVGPDDPQYALCLNNLATLFNNAGDRAQAESLLREVLEIRGRVLGKDHPDYALSLNNLGLLLSNNGDDAVAEPMLLRAAEIYEPLSPDHPMHAIILNNLAALYTGRGHYDQAAALHERVRRIRERKLGVSHPDYGLTLNNLAQLHFLRGEQQEAAALFRQALRIHEDKLGGDHPMVAQLWNSLAVVHAAEQKFELALPLAERSVESFRRHLERASAAQSQRQQLAMLQSLRSNLDGYLSVALAAQQPGSRVYQPALEWKGAVFLRQWQIRQSSRNPAAALLLKRLLAVDGRLATMAYSAPEASEMEIWRRQLSDLSSQKEQLERELADGSRLFRSGAKNVSAIQLQDSLPANVVLLDFLEFDRMERRASDGRWQSQRRLLGFSICADQPIKAVDLGPTDSISETIDVWRRDYGNSKPAAAAARTLKQLLWTPFQDAIQGKEIALVSPDGAVSRLPWAALPGAKPNTYLLEEIAIGVIPVPQLAARTLMAGADPRAESATNPSTSSLLLVGDIDYDAASGPRARDAGVPITAVPADALRRAAARDGQWKFSPLDNVGAEIASVRASFEQLFQRPSVRQLSGQFATESEFRKLVGRHRFTHLATHGFFAPAALQSSLGPTGRPGAAVIERPGTHDPFARRGVTGFHPGLLSGLALSGANRPRDADREDGILTALEVAALDLMDVELLCLSACETGLGEAAGGEGLLGLQRAFQVAGAHSVVASLWKVDDHATRILMTEFYRNLWQEKRTRIESLRQAQLAMLRRYDPQRRTLQPRGLIIPNTAPQISPNTATPFHWAAFVLSGEWR